MPLAEAVGVPADVRAVDFFGHDADVHLRLDDATALGARVLSTSVPQVGDRLAVSVDGPGVALSATPDAASERVR